MGGPREILEAGLAVAERLRVPLLYHYREPLDTGHVVGPVAFRPFFYVMNPRAAGYRSYFGIVGV